MGILRAIRKQHFEAMERHKSWDFTYWAFDLHGTIIVPNYKHGDIPREFYPYAKKVLQMLTKRDDICMYIYTCSHPHEQEKYIKYFKDNDINFKWVNENPEVETQNNGYGYYVDKPYFNVLFEDKAGFDPMEDWEDIYDFFKYREMWYGNIWLKIKRLLKNGF
jgi:hypothetical protein